MINTELEVITFAAEDIITSSVPASIPSTSLEAPEGCTCGGNIHYAMNPFCYLNW